MLTLTPESSNRESRRSSVVGRQQLRPFDPYCSSISVGPAVLQIVFDPKATAGLSQSRELYESERSLLPFPQAR
jgi:hypothetical protein